MRKHSPPPRTRDDYLVLGRRLFDLREELVQVLVHELDAWTTRAGRNELAAALHWLDRARNEFDKQFHKDGLRDPEAEPEFPMYPGKERHATS